MKRRADCLSHLKTVCRSAGLKLTQQRIEIFAELANASDHPSPETLHRRLRPRMNAISLDTVYRTLATLARHNLVQQVETFQSPVRYEAVQPSHHHLICRECGEISDFPWSSFDRITLPEETSSWGIVERRSAVVTGVCRKCGAKTNGKRRTRMCRPSILRREDANVVPKR